MEIIKQRRKLNRLIKNSKNIFLMGHKNLDLDALGSQVGMYMILKKKKKNCFIIIDDKVHEAGVEKVLRELDGVINIIKSSQIEEHLDPRSFKNLLIILDTNKEELVQSETALEKINRKLIIDHHNIGKSTIKKAEIIDDTKVSSTCEMITSLIEYYDVELDPYYATILLSGIVLDTNNYTLNTSAETFYSSYYLASLGASAKKVQYLLKQDIEDYTERQKLMANIETLEEHIAITHASTSTQYRREDLARVADTLLFFNNIEASFVIGKLDKDTIGISARSLGSYNIDAILKKFNGGGDSSSGAATIKKGTIAKVTQELKKYIREGE